MWVATSAIDHWGGIVWSSRVTGPIVGGSAPRGMARSNSGGLRLVGLELGGLELVATPRRGRGVDVDGRRRWRIRPTRATRAARRAGRCGRRVLTVRVSGWWPSVRITLERACGAAGMCSWRVRGGPRSRSADRCHKSGRASSRGPRGGSGSELDAYDRESGCEVVSGNPASVKLLSQVGTRKAAPRRGGRGAAR